MKSSIAVSLSALLLAACASGTSARAGGPQGTTARRDANVITAEEIRANSAQTLYDAVSTLRPAWMLRSRPTALLPQNEAQLIVYLDGTRFGNMDSLRQLAPGSVQTVRYFSPSAAEARFGPGHLKGAIEVTTAGR
jgi:hypothetical protein